MKKGGIIVIVIIAIIILWGVCGAIGTNNKLVPMQQDDQSKWGQV
jgi:hypothetical protein